MLTFFILIMNETIQANKFFGSASVNNDIIIIGENISTPENIGSIIRLTDNIGAKKLFLINKIIPNQSKIKRSSSSAYNNVDFQFVDYDFLYNDIFKGYLFVGIDTINNSKNIYKFSFPKKVVFVVGSEKNGLSSKIIEYCNEFVHIPMPGQTKSMNVSHALAVSLFEYYRQHL